MEQPQGLPLANTITLGVRNIDTQRAFSTVCSVGH